MKDYSQWGEGKFIVDFFKGKSRGRFLDIGAFDGITGSNTRNLSDLGWDGLCIEASPFNFPALLENHRGNPRITCLLAAVIPYESEHAVEFYDAGGQIGTTMANHKLGHHVKRKYRVAGITPNEIFQAFGSRWDFVSLDIEGADLAVLECLGVLLTETQMICVEDAIPNMAFDKGYHDRLLAAAAEHGFTKVIATTTDSTRSANTLLARP